MMRQDRFTLTPPLSLRERVQDAPPSVILSGDHARAGNQRPPRRNLGRGEPSVSQDAVRRGLPQNAKMPNKLQTQEWPGRRLR